MVREALGLSRRGQSEPHCRTRARAGELGIDAGKRQARLGRRVLPLEPKAHAVLVYLVERRERVVGKDEIFAAVWPDVAVTDNALTRVIAQLRREPGDVKSPRSIETATKPGSRFIADIEDSAPAPRAARSWQRWLAPAAAAVMATLIGLSFGG
ncbi:MAG: winged helix-turn-helix domain-containing protein [Bryobacteraceae bacterium]|nr:winged helix-turn-helix domain-containing protein [Bryobacteraceae bacterium]